MPDTQPSQEFRITYGSVILNFIRKFSATEKAIFGVFVIGLILSALVMAKSVSDHFLVEIPAHGGVLREGLVGLPRTVNPILAVTDADRDISSLVYSGLTSYENGQIVPDLATSWKVSSDGLTYTFNLRPDAHFSDGQLVTADDVAFTIQKIQDPGLKSPRAADWADVIVKTIPATTGTPAQIRFSLKQAYAPFLTNTTVGIIPKHIWDSVSDDQFIFNQHNVKPIGSGPYAFSSMTSDSAGVPTSYRLETWSGYYGKIPYLGEINFNFYADADKALSALDNGSIDSLPSIAPAEAAKLATNGGEAYRILSSPLPRIFGVFFNQNQNPVFADHAVRQALDMSVDRAAIVASALQGYGLAIHGPLPVSLIDNALDSASSTSPNLAGARTLLEKSGWKKNPATGVYEKKDAKNVVTVLSFDIYTADTPDLKQAATMVKDSWTKLGAQVDVKIFDSSELYQNVIRTRKYDALLFGEFVGKDRDLYAFWNSGQRNAPGLNVAMYVNSSVDKLLDSIRVTADTTARAALYDQFNDAIAADTPAVFLYVPDFIYAVPKNLHNISLGNVTVPADRFGSVEKWYTQTDRVWSVFAHL